MSISMFWIFYWNQNESYQPTSRCGDVWLIRAVAWMTMQHCILWRYWWLQSVINPLSGRYSSRIACCHCYCCSYYRFVLESELQFTEFGMEVQGPRAVFDHLPPKPILTLGMDPPESWLVESVFAIYDLDNICMDEVNLLITLQNLPGWSWETSST